MSLHTPTHAPAFPDLSARSAPATRFSARRLATATAAALAASVLGVLLIRAAAVSATTDTGRFTPLQPASVISLTVVGVLLAAAICLWLNRVSARPVATFRVVALGALLLSLIPDAAIWISAHYPQTRAATVLPLMAMHVLVAGVCLATLPRLGQAERS
jgi:hypothetical protein